MLFLFWWGVHVDEITSFCLDIFPVCSPSWSRSTLQERPSWPQQSSPSAQVKSQAVSRSDSSSCHFLFPFRQTWVRFLKRGCGCGITSRRLRSGPGIRAADRRTLRTRRMEPQTWRARRSASASAPPRRPASSSTSAPSPPTSWRRLSNPPVRARIPSLLTFSVGGQMSLWSISRRQLTKSHFDELRVSESEPDGLNSP